MERRDNTSFLSHYQERRSLSQGVSFGVYLPDVVLTNEEIESWNTTTRSGTLLTAESIFQKTGIRQRYVADDFETSVRMGVAAANQAMTGKDSTDVEAVFASTSYPTGEHVAGGIAKYMRLQPDYVRDFYAACSGFAEMLYFLKQHENQFQGRDILMASSERYSPTLVDLRREDAALVDPSLAQTIFSDGAYALRFRYGEDLTVLGANHMRVPFGGDKNPIEMPICEESMVEPFTSVSVPYSDSGYFRQDGKEVYRSVRKYVPSLIEQTLVKTEEVTGEDIRGKKPLIIPHQGSIHVVETIANQLDYPILNDVQDGNFSSASIPKALSRAFDERVLQKGDYAVLAGFGAGLFASVAVVQF